VNYRSRRHLMPKAQQQHPPFWAIVPPFWWAASVL
jgi:hypothetical protein